MINLANALQVFSSHGINIEDDFHTLTSSQVEVVLTQAKRDSYRCPTYAGGSKARMYFQALQRQHRNKK
jgi:hypothetical protein